MHITTDNNNLPSALDLLPEADKKTCSAIFGRYMHFARFASTLYKCLSDTLQEFTEVPEQATQPEAAELAILQRNIETFRDTVTVLSITCVSDIEDYFMDTYYLVFKRLPSDQYGKGVLLTTFEPVIANMLKQTGSNLYAKGLQRLIRETQTTYQYTNAAQTPKRIVFSKMVTYYRSPNDDRAMDYNRITILLHAVALFLHEKLFLTPPIHELLNI